MKVGADQRFGIHAIAEVLFASGLVTMKLLSIGKTMVSKFETSEM
jgi:hypothetical protein